MQRIYFIIAGVCYKLIQWLRISNKINSTDIAVFANDDLGLRISCLGEFEADILTFLRQNIADKMHTKTLLDVGANIGNHTYGLNDYFAECHVFEADPRTYNLLCANMADMKNVICHQLAISSANGTASFSSDRINTGRSHIIPQQDQFGASIDHDDGDNEALTFEVETKKLDDAQLGDREIGLLKIDVEGHELQVLEGAAYLLRRQKPVVLIELLETDIINGRAASLDYLFNVGYGRFQSIETPTMRIAALNNFPLLRWINHIIHALEVILIGQRSAKAVDIDITNLTAKNYDAVLARE